MSFPGFLRSRQSDTATDRDLRHTVHVLYFLIVAGVLTIWRFSPGEAYAPLMWALACLASGMAVGFLFGIPKILQGDLPPAPPAAQRDAAGKPPENKTDKASSPGYHQQVNTNLEQISDWLTKILVGLGLVHLGKIKGYLDEAANTVAASMNGGSAGKSFALAIIIYFSIVGFFIGYLLTRMFLAGAFGRADLAAIGTSPAVQAKLDSLDVEQSQIKAAVFKNATGAAAVSAVITDPTTDTRLMELADAYVNVQGSGAVRVRHRSDTSSALLAYLAENRGRISKDVLANYAEKTDKPHDGLLLGLAALVHFDPEAGDLTRLAAIRNKTSSQFTKYRIVMAIGILFSRGFATAADQPQAEKMLAMYEAGADDSLAKKIKQTRELIAQCIATPASQ